MSYIFNRENYEAAKANGLVERFRGDEISRRISKISPIHTQIALDKNIIKDLLNGTREHYAEWLESESIREKVKAEVDEEIKTFEST